MSPDRPIKPVRAYLPSDHGQPVDRRASRTAFFQREKVDARRGETDHVRRLAAEIQRRRVDGTLYQGSDSDLAQDPSLGDENPRTLLDIVRKSDDLCVVAGHREEKRVKTEDEAAAVTEPKTETEAPTAKAPAKRARKPKAKVVKSKPKNKKAAKAKKVKKPVKNKKAATKTGKKSKKKALKEQTCINLPIALKAKLDAMIEKLNKKLEAKGARKTSRNKILNELAAKFVGWKNPKKIAS